MESSNTPQKPAGTRYVVLAEVPHTRDEIDVTVTDLTGKKWQVAATVAAPSAEAAIRKHADGAPDKSAGTFVAIPERSWKPVKVTVSTETIVKLG